MIIAFISRKNGSETVFKVISASSLETYTIDIKPSAPEKSSKPVHVAVDNTTSVVSARKFDNGLDIEINNTNDTGWS